MMKQTPNGVTCFCKAVEPVNLVGENASRQSTFGAYASPEALMVAAKKDQLTGLGLILLLP